MVHGCQDEKPRLRAVQERVPSATASEPAPTKTCEQSDSHVGQPQRSCASTADLIKLCPLAVEHCPARHIQFQPEPLVHKPSQSTALQPHTCNFHHGSAPHQRDADTVRSIAALPTGVKSMLDFSLVQQQTKAVWPLSLVQPSTAVAQVQASAPELHDRISVGQPQHNAVAQCADLQRHGFGESAGQKQHNVAAHDAGCDLANAVACSLPTGGLDDPVPNNAAPDSSSR